MIKFKQKLMKFWQILLKCAPPARKFFSKGSSCDQRGGGIRLEKGAPFSAPPSPPPKGGPWKYLNLSLGVCFVKKA